MKKCVASLGALLFLFHSCSGFIVGRPARGVGFQQLAQTPTEPAADEPPSEATANDEIAQEDPIEESSSEEGEGEQKEEEKEDPEMVALKAEIAELESTLKMARSKLAYTSDKADDYSKAGYARKVAEMESIRRNSQVRAVNLDHVPPHVLLSHSCDKNLTNRRRWRLY